MDSDNKAVLQLANLHGDIVATATLGQPGLNNYTETDEYGRTQGAAGEVSSGRYGWLGAHQRDTNTIGGLTLMGARLYNPTTGRFLSIDPVDGGNDNRYTYPADPINKLDLDGDFAIVLVIGIVLVCVLVVAAGYASTPSYQSSASRTGRAFSQYIRRVGDGFTTLGARAIAAGLGLALSIRRTKAVKKQTRAAQKEETKQKDYSERGDNHRNNKTKSHKPKHEKGDTRRKTDKGGERGDGRRYYAR